MARAQGAWAQMALAFETTYGTAPAGGYPSVSRMRTARHQRHSGRKAHPKNLEGHWRAREVDSKPCSVIPIDNGLLPNDAKRIVTAIIYIIPKPNFFKINRLSNSRHLVNPARETP